LDVFPAAALHHHHHHHHDVRRVELTKGPSDSLGVSIAGGLGSPLGDVPIFIAMMNPGGLAAQTQQLKVKQFSSKQVPTQRVKRRT